MASASDLTTLADVKAWLAITSNASDTLLASLITAHSRAMYAYLVRPQLAYHVVTERRDGNGVARLMLRQWPVLSVSSIVVGSIAVPAGTAPAAGTGQQAGYLLDPWDGAPPGAPQMVDLIGYDLARGRQNVALTYAAGYVVQGEAATVPATPYKVTAAAPYGAFAGDVGVTDAGTGAALTMVSGTPLTGQYAVDATGVYTFAAADTGRAVLLSYSYVPADLARATIEWIGDAYRAMDRIGQASKSLGGQETVSYIVKDMPDKIKLMLAPYRSVVPVL